MLDFFFASEIVYTHQWNQQKFHIWTWKSLRKEDIFSCTYWQLPLTDWNWQVQTYEEWFWSFPSHFYIQWQWELKTSQLTSFFFFFLRIVSRDFFTSVIQLSNYLPFSLPYIIHTPFHLSIHRSTHLFMVPISGTHLYTHHAHLCLYIYTCTYLYIPSCIYSPAHRSSIYICIYHLHPKLLAWNHPMDGIS